MLQELSIQSGSEWEFKEKNIILSLKMDKLGLQASSTTHLPLISNFRKKFKIFQNMFVFLKYKYINESNLVLDGSLDCF